MVTISNFTSVFEVSIAIHVAYSLITNLHNLPVNTLRKSLSAFSQLAKKLEDEEKLSPENRKIVDRELISTSLCLKAHEELSKPLITIFVVTSLGVATFSLCCLIFSGYFPEAQITCTSMAAILSVSLLPMPAFMLATYLIMKKRLEPLREDFNETYQELNELVSETRVKK